MAKFTGDAATTFFSFAREQNGSRKFENQNYTVETSCLGMVLFSLITPRPSRQATSEVSGQGVNAQTWQRIPVLYVSERFLEMQQILKDEFGFKAGVIWFEGVHRWKGIEVASRQSE